jgi:hypothetical protein
VYFTSLNILTIVSVIKPDDAHQWDVDDVQQWRWAVVVVSGLCDENCCCGCYWLLQQL